MWMEVERRDISNLTVGGEGDIVGSGLGSDARGGGVDIKAMSSSSYMSGSEEESSALTTAKVQRDHEGELTLVGRDTTDDVKATLFGIGRREEDNNDQKSNESHCRRYV